MQLATSLPFELQKTVVQSTEAAKTLRLYSIYLEMRMTIYSSGTKADVVAAKWVAAEEKANAKTKAEQKAFALSSTSLKSRRMSCISIKQGLVEEGRMLVDLLRSLTTTISRFGQDDPDGEDQLNQHAVNILEQDLFHLSSAICEAVISVLAVFTKLKLEDARAGLALYASSIEAINGAKSCCRACHLSPATRESMAALKLPNSDLFLALADHVGKLSEAAEKGNTSTSSSHNKSGSLSSGKGTSLSRKQSSTSARLGDKASVSTPPISPKKPKGHKRIASLPESLAGAAAKTGLFKSVGRALRHT